jgi:hypothetical protein
MGSCPDNLAALDSFEASEATDGNRRMTHHIAPEVEQTQLSSNVTVAQYRAMERDQDKTSIADFIVERMSERYITPLGAVPAGKKSGFLIMASACLLVESLESFFNGWEDNHVPMSRNSIAAPCTPTKSTTSRSEVAFCYFFQREQEFATFQPHAYAFYKHVRCGILHQGETSGGWRITRKAGTALIDESKLTINANKFLRALKRSVGAYGEQLANTGWHDDIWQKFRTKMAFIINHCAR